MFFTEKGKKKIKVVWAIISVMVVLSMVLLYAPGLFR